MMAGATTIEITTAPFLRTARSTSRIMFEVVLSLVPVLVAAMWFFGISALLVAPLESSCWTRKNDLRHNFAISLLSAAIRHEAGNNLHNY